MRKFCAIIGMLFCCAVIYVGVQYLNGNSQYVGGSYVSAPSTSSSAPSYYDSGYASFGGDFYSFVNNNAADAAKAARTIASNQIQVFEQLSQIKRTITRFFGYFLVAFGGVGVCLFGCLCFSPKPIAASPAVEVPTGTSINQSGETADALEKGKEALPFICESCGESFTGWYQECPNCHAVGKMKKRD